MIDIQKRSNELILQFELLEKNEEIVQTYFMKLKKHVLEKIFKII